MLANLIVALYALLPITLLTSHTLPSVVFYALLSVSLIFLAVKRFEGALDQTLKYRWLIGGYSVLFLVVALSSAYHGQWAGANSEGALRFLLGLWILLLALPHINVYRSRSIIWGVYAATLISTVILCWLVLNDDERPETPALIIVTYTSLMMLLSALTIYSLKWQLTRYNRLESVLKILLALTAFIVFLTAQTRTGLLGLPMFILLAAVLFVGIKHPKRIVALVLTSSVLLIAAVALSDDMRERIVQGIQEVQACHGDNSTQPSSMCLRLQFWRTAINAGSSSPWVGLGDSGKFIQYIQEVAIPEGWTTPYVIKQYFGEPHNDLLVMFVGFGFPGVLSLLLIYLTPCGYFLPRLLSRQLPQAQRAAAAMGLAVCLGFLLFGLTETMFRRMNTIGFYATMVALFMVLSESTRQDTSPLSD